MVNNRSSNLASATPANRLFIRRQDRLGGLLYEYDMPLDQHG
jgi:hypothetical protein